jgi:hypothetical protein
VQNPSTAMRVLFQVLVVGDLLVIIYLTFFVGLARLPFHDLPLYYWLVLFLLPVLQLISELVWGSPHFGRGNSSRMKNAITRFSIGGLFLLLGDSSSSRNRTGMAIRLSWLHWVANCWFWHIQSTGALRI